MSEERRVSEKIRTKESSALRIEWKGTRVYRMHGEICLPKKRNTSAETSSPGNSIDRIGVREKKKRSLGKFPLGCKKTTGEILTTG